MTSKMHCCICWSHDETDWGALECGHIFHYNCVHRSLGASRACPMCRRNVSKSGGEYKIIRLFLQAHDETQPEEPVDLVEDHDADTSAKIQTLNLKISSLKTQIKMRDNELQDLRVVGHEHERAVQQLRAEQMQLREILSKSESRYQTAVAESNQLAVKNSRLQNEAATLRTKLEQERSISARLRIAMDPQLVGEQLKRQLGDLASSCTQIPEWFPSLLETRNNMLREANRRADRAEAQQRTTEAAAQQETLTMQRKIADLQAEIEMLRMAAGGRAACETGGGENSTIACGVSKKAFPAGPRRGGLLFRGGRSKASAIGGRYAVSEEPLWQDDLYGLNSLPSSGRLKESTPGVRLGSNNKPSITMVPDVRMVQPSSEDDEIEVVPESPPPPRNQSEKLMGDPHAAGNDYILPGAANRRAAGADVLVAAGPSKLGMAAAPGPSFISRRDRATTGLHDTAQFIQKGPDGKGGISTVYHRDGTSSAGGGGGGRVSVVKKAKLGGFRDLPSHQSETLQISHFFGRA